MSIIRSFWITNVKREMALYGKEITVDDLRHCTQISTVMDEFDKSNEIDDGPEDFESSDKIPESISLDVNSIANLDHTIFSDEVVDQMVQTNLNAVVAPGNIEYNVDDLVSHFLNEGAWFKQ